MEVRAGVFAQVTVCCACVCVSVCVCMYVYVHVFINTINTLHTAAHCFLVFPSVGHTSKPKYPLRSSVRKDKKLTNVVSLALTIALTVLYRSWMTGMLASSVINNPLLA